MLQTGRGVFWRPEHMQDSSAILRNIKNTTRGGGGGGGGGGGDSSERRGKEKHMYSRMRKQRLSIKCCVQFNLASSYICGAKMGSRMKEFSDET